MNSFHANLRFPEKLWLLINDERRKSICWSQFGNSILLRPKLFDKDCRKQNIFKTKKFSSIIRQLNLYGFGKVSEASPSYVEYYHSKFIRNRHDLVQFVTRNSSRLEKRTTKKEGKLLKLKYRERSHANGATVSKSADFSQHSTQAFQRDDRMVTRSREYLSTYTYDTRQKKYEVPNDIRFDVPRSRERPRTNNLVQRYSNKENENPVLPSKQKPQWNARYSQSTTKETCQSQSFKYKTHDTLIQVQDEKKPIKRKRSLNRVKEEYCSSPIFVGGVPCPTKLLLKRHDVSMDSEHKYKRTKHDEEQIQIRSKNIDNNQHSIMKELNSNVVKSIMVSVPIEKIPRFRKTNDTQQESEEQVTPGMSKQDNQCRIKNEIIDTSQSNCKTPTLSQDKAEPIKHDSKTERNTRLKGSEDSEDKQHIVLSYSEYIIEENIQTSRLILTPTSSRCKVNKAIHQSPQITRSAFKSKENKHNQYFISHDPKLIQDKCFKTTLSSKKKINKEPERPSQFFQECHDEVKGSISAFAGTEEIAEITYPAVYCPKEQRTPVERDKSTSYFPSCYEKSPSESSASEDTSYASVPKVESPDLFPSRNNELDCLFTYYDRNHSVDEKLMLYNESTINYSNSDGSWISSLNTEMSESASGCSGYSVFSPDTSPANSITDSGYTYEYCCSQHNSTCEGIYQGVAPFSDSDNLKNICDPNISPGHSTLDYYGDISDYFQFIK